MQMVAARRSTLAPCHRARQIQVAITGGINLCIALAQLDPCSSDPRQTVIARSQLKVLVSSGLVGDMGCNSPCFGCVVEPCRWRGVHGISL